MDFHGEKRSNQTHESKTDPDAKLARKAKGKEAKLSYSGNLLVENRNGLIVNAELLEANGRAERDAALVMLEQIPDNGRITVGGDKGFDTQEFVEECRRMNVTPHVAQNDGRRGGSAIDARTTRHTGYPEGQKKRKRIEECFGWLKDRAAAQTQTSRHTQSGVDLYLRGSRLQPGATEKTCSNSICGLMRPWCSRGRLQSSAERNISVVECSEHQKTGENKKFSSAIHGFSAYC